MPPRLGGGMTAQALEAICQRLKGQAGLHGKADIRAAARSFVHLPFPELGAAAALGDDAALLPAVGGRLLLACEGLQPELVEEDPWFAGWSGVLVNLSDIAAMGGTPLAVVNSIWSKNDQHAEQLLAGMRHAADCFAVPVVGGHTNLRSPYNALSVAVLGSSGPMVLSARAARPGQLCCLLINTSGEFYRHYPFWDAATKAEPKLLREHLALMAQLAALGLVLAAKDISMGGLVGTGAMFAEAAGCRLSLELEAIVPPPGVALEAWLSCFPSYGYLLAVEPAQLEPLHKLVRNYPDLHCGAIGSFQPGGSELELRQGGQSCSLWSGREPLTGFGALAT
jgi:AIR synthase-related protein